MKFKILDICTIIICFFVGSLTAVNSKLLFYIASVLPRVSNSLAAGIGRRGGQLASLMSWSERLSQRAYSRPSTTSTGVHEGLSSEINTTRYYIIYNPIGVYERVSAGTVSILHRIILR